jgi:hypothetical protein
MMTKAKIGLLARVVRHGSEALRAVVCDAGDWLKEAKLSIEKVAKRDADFADLPGFEKGQWWSDFFKNKYCTARIKKLAKRAAAFDAEDAESQEEEKKGEQEDSEEESDERMCGTCGAVFRSLQALNSHRSLAHAWRHAGTILAKEGRSVCQRCQVQFWTPAKLAAHLKQNQECLDWESMCLPCEEPSEVLARAKAEAFDQAPPAGWPV